MPKDILILKHIGIEGPGSIAGFFQSTAWNLQAIDLSVDGLLPDDLAGIEAIISLGGPMGVYEEDKYSFLKQEDKFLKRALKEKIPILGICLGAQLLAKACGAKVKKAPSKEIGWSVVNLTEAGKLDPLFQGLPAQLSVFQWHEDTFEIPAGGIQLAGSPDCANQAFRFGRNAYGLQFHLEVSPEIIGSWVDRYVTDDRREPDYKDMLMESYKRDKSYGRQAEMVYLNLARIIAASREGVAVN